MPFSYRRFIALFSLITLTFLLSTAILGAEDKPAPATDKKGEDVLATVGETSITRAMLEAELKNFDNRPNAQSGKVDHKQFLKEMIELTLLEQEAAKQPEINTPEFKADQRKISSMIISQSLVQELIAKTASETPKEAAPATPVAPAIDRYHLHQMTFKTSDEAGKAKKELEGGKSFQDLAKASSTDNFKESGGDRGFVLLADVPPAIADSLKALKKDAVSDPIADGSETFRLIKYSEMESTPAPVDEKAEANAAQRAAFEKVMADLTKKMDVKVEDANLKLLEKGSLSPEEQEKTLMTIGTEVVKLSAILPDFEQIPEFIRPQILGGEGLKDFVKQFTYRETVKRYVEGNYEELAKKYPQSQTLSHREASIRSLLNSKMKTITVSDEDVKDFYSKNMNQFSQPEQMRAHHILVDTEDQAKAIMERLNKNEKLEDIAKTDSKCPSGKEGGDLGMFEKGRMVPEFEAALEKAEIGKNIGPVKTKFGFHIVRLDEKKSAGTASLDDVKDRIKAQLLPKKQKETFETLLNDLKKKYPVKDFPEKL